MNGRANSRSEKYEHIGSQYAKVRGAIGRIIVGPQEIFALQAILSRDSLADGYELHEMSQPLAIRHLITFDKSRKQAEQLRQTAFGQLGAVKLANFAARGIHLRAKGVVRWNSHGSTKFGIDLDVADSSITQERRILRNKMPELNINSEAFRIALINMRGWNNVSFYSSHEEMFLAVPGVELHFDHLDFVSIDLES